MDKETNQQIPSLLPNNNTTSILEDSTRKPGGGASGGVGGSDRSKRDEWSEGAVSCLLEAYESKWIFRNRAKLKGHDWEDVASFVSSRANSTKSSKTQTQCKNKIESMKKRYRSESATADTSSWPLYPRLDNLLRGTGQPPPAVPPPPSPPPPPPPPPDHDLPPPFMLLEPSPSPTQAPPPPAPPAPAPPALGLTQHSHGSNGVDRMAKEDGDGTRSEHLSDKKVIESDSSTPVLAYSDKDKKWRSKKYLKTKMEKKKRRKRSSDNQDQMEIAESIRWVAEVVVRSEQARMEMMRDIERMRIEAEAKRGEIDLKQTEIIANTQLEIARLFATSIGKTGTGPGGGAGGSVDSSLRIGRC